MKNLAGVRVLLWLKRAVKCEGLQAAFAGCSPEESGIFPLFLKYRRLELVNMQLFFGGYLVWFVGVGGMGRLLGA
jgi:hypothetical protein